MLNCYGFFFILMIVLRRFRYKFIDERAQIDPIQLSTQFEAKFARSLDFGFSENVVISGMKAYGMPFKFNRLCGRYSNSFMKCG